MLKHQQGCWLFATANLLFSGSLAAGTVGNSVYGWSGYYFGTKAGAVFSQFDMQTVTQEGSLFTVDDANLVNSFGHQTLNATGVLAGIEAGYDWQLNDNFLIGLQADIQSLGTSVLKYTDAVPYLNNNAQFVLTSYANNNWLLTARPRLGFVTNNALLYATGGLGLSFLQNDFLFSNNLGEFQSARVRKVRPGYIIGAGVETSLTQRISLKTEYLFEEIASTNASLMNQNVPPIQTFANHAKMNANILSVGLNYHLEEQLANPLLSSLSFDPSHWKTQFGARLFFNTGLTGAPQPLLNTSPIGDLLASRLIFSDLAATTEEVFTRIDHSSGLFVKGTLGAGTITKGVLNDEDFPAGPAYSNTSSNALGNLSYATLDLGYRLLTNALGSTGLFVGYNYYAPNVNIYSCSQIAGSDVCQAAFELTNFLVLSENDQFNSVRLGLASEFNLTKQWSISSEVAYIPYVHFRGLDMHNARQLVGPEESDKGDGAMLEAILNYQLTSNWGVGLGGRYWMWNMHNGSLLFDFLGQNDELITEPARFNADRYGAFVQIQYHPSELTDTSFVASPSRWKGIFVGGSLGGAWSNSDWTDPFNSTIAAPGFYNVAGFGDYIQATGPLLGVDLHMNWSLGRLIYGLGGTISAVDIRGENTLFSGLGGINGQEISNSLGTIVGRIGTAWNQALFYVDAGGAILNTTYKLNGNTNDLNLGTGDFPANAWGWTAGIGVEYALNGSWSSNVEYDYIGIPYQALSFPSVGLVNVQPISAKHQLNTFKLGVNYKFGSKVETK